MISSPPSRYRCVKRDCLLSVDGLIKSERFLTSFINIKSVRKLCLWASEQWVKVLPLEFSVNRKTYKTNSWLTYLEHEMLLGKANIIGGLFNHFSPGLGVQTPWERQEIWIFHDVIQVLSKRHFSLKWSSTRKSVKTIRKWKPINRWAPRKTIFSIRKDINFNVTFSYTPLYLSFAIFGFTSMTTERRKKNLHQMGRRRGDWKGYSNRKQREEVCAP